MVFGTYTINRLFANNENCQSNTQYAHEPDFVPSAITINAVPRLHLRFTFYAAFLVRKEECGMTVTSHQGSMIPPTNNRILPWVFQLRIRKPSPAVHDSHPSAAVEVSLLLYLPLDDTSYARDPLHLFSLSVKLKRGASHRKLG